jgi:hypothetical protein
MDVIITGRFGDLVIRAIAPSFSTAVERGRDLRRLGWVVELADEAGNPVLWEDQIRRPPCGEEAAS